tara:strand:+ start:3178 stop:5601 length:2424 start_codon:yes stop_codon:yes gene_type:complete
MSSCRNEIKETINLLDFVPQNSIGVVQINDPLMLDNTLKRLSFLEGLAKLDFNLQKNISAVIPETKSPNSILILTPQGKSDIAVSYVFRHKESDSTNYKILESFVYNSVKVDVSIEKERKVYAARIRDINIKSNSQLVLENCIRNIQNKQKGIQDDQFYRLAKLSNTDAILTVFLHEDIRNIMNKLFPKTKFFPFLGSSWFSFDFNTKKDPFTLDGISFINDSIPDGLTLYKNLNSKMLVSQNFVPRSFDNYFALSVSDYKTLEENFKEFVLHKNLAFKKINFNPLSNVSEIAFINNKSSEATYLHLKNSEILEPNLFSGKNIVDNYRGIKIINHELPEDIFGFLKSLGVTHYPKYSAKIEGILVYTKEKSYLKQLIGIYLDGKTLGNDMNFSNLKEDFADNSTFIWIGDTDNLKDAWKKESKKNFKKWGNIKLKPYPLIAIQGVSEDNVVQSRFTAQKNNPNQPKNSVTNQFRFNLDAPLANNPQWIRNHINKTMDIVIQDENNVLYLFSNNGDLFWKKQLSGPIIGKIQQVDLYKNRRLQMVFRTQDRFIILDRNGKIVPPFNIKLPNDSPRHLSVFDYDGNRNYRFLLNHGKKIEMFNKKGERVSGFKLNSLKKPLLHPPKHIRFGNKDYIVLQDTDGKVRIIDRQGKDRIIVQGKLETLVNPIFAYRKTFASTNKNGSLVQIDVNGNVNKTGLELKIGHKIDMTSKSLVTLSENKLMIKGIPVILPFGNYSSPKIFYIDNTIYVTITEYETKKVFAFYSNGNPVRGFPVYGTSVADLTNADNDKAIEMIVQSDQEELTIYQIN